MCRNVITRTRTSARSGTLKKVTIPNKTDTPTLPSHAPPLAAGLWREAGLRGGLGGDGIAEERRWLARLEGVEPLAEDCDVHVAVVALNLLAFVGVDEDWHGGVGLEGHRQWNRRLWAAISSRI